MGINSKYLKVSNNHSIFVETIGKNNNPAIIYLHGGPGNGCEEKHQKLFDPSLHFGILIDQRGCGRSLSKLSKTKENSTWDLVEDIEKVINDLKLKKVTILGSSWGTTLALCFAIKYPKRVNRLILKSIFLARESDRKWLYSKDGLAKLLPVQWEEFIKDHPDSSANELVNSYFTKYTAEKNRSNKNHLLKQWYDWHGAAYFYPQENLNKEDNSFINSEFAQNTFFLESYYELNNYFFSDTNFILNNINNINQIDVNIIHGEKDFICPKSQATDFQQAHNKCQVNIIPNCGHGSNPESNIIVQNILKGIKS